MVIARWKVPASASQGFEIFYIDLNVSVWRQIGETLFLGFCFLREENKSMNQFKKETGGKKDEKHNYV